MPISLSSPCQIIPLIIVLFILAIISWRRPVLGLALVVFCLPFYLLKTQISCLPTNVFELMVGVVGVVGVVGGRFRGVGGLRGVGGFFIPSGMILAGVCLAILFSGNPLVGAGILKGWFLVPLVLAFFVFLFVESKKQLKILLAALILSGGAVSVISLFYFFQGQLTFDGRLAAFYLSPNHLAMYLAPIFILGFGFWPGLKNFWLKLVLFLVEGLMFLVIYLTFSYGAWVGIAAALIVLLLYREHFSMRIALVVGLAGILILSQLGTEKFSNLINFERSSIQSRLMVWRAGLTIAKDYPIFGIGPGMFQEKYLAYQEKFAVPYLEWAVPQPHNLFLAFWLQAGILGILGFLGLLGVFFKKAIFLAKKEPLAVTLIAVMTYIVIHGLIDTTYWKNDLAAIFWLIVTMMVVITRDYKAAHLSD